VEPSEYAAGLVGGGRERGGELSCEPVEGGDGLAGELLGVCVWDGEVAADEAGGRSGRGGFGGLEFREVWPRREGDGGRAVFGGVGAWVSAIRE